LGISIAGSAPGSSVILCTDGLANQGAGSLEGSSAEVTTAFYLECAEQALLKGVTVSVISLIGAECSLEKLSQVTERTGGTVERVNPAQLTGELDAIVGAPQTLAYGSMAMVLLHRGLRFDGEMDDENDERFWLVRDLGNVTAASECSFRYAFRPRQEADLTGLTSVPFQVQLLYTRPDGAVYLRVASAAVALTSDRQQAEAKADVAVVGNHAAQRAAKLAKKGDYEAAQMESRAAQRFLQRQGDTESLEVFSKQVETLDSVLRDERQKEASAPAAPAAGAAQARVNRRGDVAAQAISKTTNMKML